MFSYNTQKREEESTKGIEIKLGTYIDVIEMVQKKKNHIPIFYFRLQILVHIYLNINTFKHKSAFWRNFILKVTSFILRCSPYAKSCRSI